MTERQQENLFATNTVTTSVAGDGGDGSHDQTASSRDFHGVLDTSAAFPTYNIPDLSTMVVGTLRIPNPEQEPFFNGEIVDKPREENMKEHR
jgi:hypothetical protein